MSKNNQKNYGFVVAETEEQAREKIIEKFPELKDKKFTLRQDEDCLDTWFSSWLWPISVFDGINNPDNKEINYYYPTNDLVTAPEIIFFWVARMIMAGYEYRQKHCFSNVYFTGIVRDKLGRKMSKSLGNSPDPIELMNKYGADGVRMGMLLTSPAGNDLPFDESLCETGRNFCNKIWNAFRLVKGWETVDAVEIPAENAMAMIWFKNLLKKTIVETEDLFSKYRLSEALMLIYKLFWDDFCAWYLEIVKPEFGKPIDNYTYNTTLFYFKILLQLLHPFMPFITEELYQTLDDSAENKSIMFSQIIDVDTECIRHDEIENFEIVKEIIVNIRNIRVSKNILPKEKINLFVQGEHNDEFNEVIKKLVNVQDIDLSRDKPENAAGFLVGTTEYFVPVEINVEEEIARMQAEIGYLEGFLKSVNTKLGNEKFVANAKPEVVEIERKKQADTQEKIAIIKAQMEQLLKK